MIWFDRTTRSVVVGCRSCGARDVALDQRHADQWAADHLARHAALEAASEVDDAERRRSVTAARVRRHRARHAG